MANGIRSGRVPALFLALWQHLGHLGTAAHVLLGLPVAGQAALVALALGLGRAGPVGWPGHFGHASTSARWRAAQRL